MSFRLNNVSMLNTTAVIAMMAGAAHSQICYPGTRIAGSSPTAQDNFASGVSMSFGGPNNQILLAVGKPGEDAPVSGTNAGGFSVHRLANNTWSMMYDSWNTTGQGGERLGASIGLSDPYLIAGAPGFNNNQGRARIYRRPDGSMNWLHSADVTIPAAFAPADAGFGSAVAISAYGGGWAVVGAPRHDWNLIESGSAYFYTRDPNTNQWAEAFHIWGGDFTGDAGAHRGESVAMSQSSPWAAVGSPDETDLGQPADHGKVTLVQRLPNGTVSPVVQQVRPVSPEAGERFGAAVGVEGDMLVVGAPLEDATLQETGFQYAAANCGAVYIYLNQNGTWNFLQKLRAPSPIVNGRFGTKVAISEDDIVITEPESGRTYFYTIWGNTVYLNQAALDGDRLGTTGEGNSIATHSDYAAIGDPTETHSSQTAAGAVYVHDTSDIISGDDCTFPTELSFHNGDTVTWCTDRASPSIGTPTTCGNGGSGQGNDVWFLFNPTCSGSAIFDTFGSEIDTVLSIHSACPNGLTTSTIVCNDDHTFPSPNNRASLVTFNFQEGVPLLIRVGGYNGASGVFTLRTNMYYAPVPNDTCVTATPVGLGTHPYANCGASHAQGIATACSTGLYDVWFKFIPPADSVYKLSTCGSNFFSMLDVFRTENCPTDGVSAIACGSPEWNSQCQGFPSSNVQVAGLAGETLYIRVSGMNITQSGHGLLTIGESLECNDIDFNNDGSLFDPQDIDAFLSVYSEGPCIPGMNVCDDIDFNNDTCVFDPCDIDSFLLVFSEGPCTLCGQ